MTIEMKKITKSVEINAPREKVWEVLVNNQLNAIWYAAFSEGTHTDTDWKVGSKALFTDSDGSGLASKVIVNDQYEALSIEHQGIVNNGVEDYESDLAKQVKGGLESYYLSENNGVTNLVIECDMSEDLLDMMSASWDDALRKISELSSGSRNKNAENTR